MKLSYKSKRSSPLQKNDQSSGRKKSRRTQEPPEIWIRITRVTWGKQYARASLRNAKGYLLLQWRDGEKVKSYYLGKAKKSSPTDRAAAAPAEASPAAARAGAPRRRKNGRRA